MSSDIKFSEWAVVARKDDTGFGRQAADIRSVLGLGYHFVCPSDRIEGRPPAGKDEFRLLPDSSPEELSSLLCKVKGVIFFENYATWHPALLEVARANNVKTICVPNWEWFRGEDPMWELCDMFACPTHFTVDVVKRYGRENARYVPWPADLSKFSARQIRGEARHFIHNAGLVDPDDRKGTRDTIKAFQRVNRDDIRLTVRLQKEVPLPKFDSRVNVIVGNLENPSDLYRTGDVAIQPSKMEGIGFMILEPVLSGIPVITSNYPPMNEFVCQSAMQVKMKWFKRRAFASNWVKHAHLRLPSHRDLARKIQWCTENDMTEISKENRRLAETTWAPNKLRAAWSELLARLI